MATIRLPVMIRVHDADLKEHEFGPVVVEIEDPQGPFDHAGDWWYAAEKAALEYLTPDMSCDGIEGAVRYSKQTKPA